MSTEPVDHVVHEALTWPAKAKTLVITSADDYRTGAEWLKGIKALRGQIAEVFGPLKAKAHAAWKAICDQEKRADAPLTEAERLIKAAMVKWDDEQRRLREEEQRRLAEAARQAEETRRLAEAAALEREAMATGDAALLQDAEALLNEPVIAPVVILPPATPKVEGVSYREVWDFEVIDPKAVPRDYLTIDEGKIRGVVKALKGDTKIPGVRVFSRRVVAAGAGR